MRFASWLFEKFRCETFLVLFRVWALEAGVFFAVPIVGAKVYQINFLSLDFAVPMLLSVVRASCPEGCRAGFCVVCFAAWFWVVLSALCF